MKRRLTAFFLILGMLTGLLPLNALAADGSEPAVESIFLSHSQVQLQVGQQLTLTAEVSPESASASAVWTSQNESIAAVENGVITAAAPGDTTISLASGSVKALCRVTVVPGEKDDPQDTESIYQKTGDYLEGLGTPAVSTTNGEWRVIGLERSGRKVTDGYYKNVVRYVLDHINENERLSGFKSTDNSRVILALTAMGYDVTNVAGHNLLAGLNEMAYIERQDINGPIWALIALDSHKYEPVGDVTRNKLVSTILAAQNPDGGWALSGAASDPDMTAMALQALAPYYGKDSKAAAAIDSALSYLSLTQNPDGRYSAAKGPATCESSVQVIVALIALGIDPDTDSRFLKNGISALDALCTYAVDGGGFSHTIGGSRNDMATEQGYYALTAYFRVKAGKTALYDMTDVAIAETRYAITEGGDSTWNGDHGDLTFKTDGTYTEFLGVNVDGTQIDKSSYAAEGDPVAVTLRKSYLNTLDLGKHRVTLLFAGCEATTGLTITEDDATLVKAVEDLIDAIGTVTGDSKAKIDAARKAYDALTDAQKNKVKNFDKLEAAERAFADLADRITVSFTLLGDTAHGDNGQEHTLAGGGLSAWIPKTTYTLTSPATVLDLFRTAVTGKYSYVNQGNYISSVNGLSEFANGTYSGWMYTLNGNHSNLGIEEQTLSNGDSVVFHYTDNYTKESNTRKAAAGSPALPKTQAADEDVYKTTGDYLEQLGTPAVGTVGGEWMVIGLARSGRKVPEGYYDNVVKYVAENIDDNERLHPAKSTDNSRLILALTAIGRDVTDVDGHNLLLGLNDMDYVQKQGVNGPIWALIALDCGNYPVPEGNVTREALLQVILNAQLEDGGWALSGGSADPDMTGMALQALAAYYPSTPRAKQAVDNALITLSGMQNADGGFSSVDGPSSESISQVIVALTALGIDPHTDGRFVKGQASALDALLRYYVNGGGFKHFPAGSRDGMATEQGYFAQTAYFRFLDQKTSLYDMTDVINKGGDVEDAPTETKPIETEPAELEASGGFPWRIVIGILVVAGAAGAAVILIRKSQKTGRH